MLLKRIAARSPANVKGVHIMAKKKKKKKKLIKGLWSKSELSLLKKLFPNNPTAEIAAKLGRPNDAVKKKASRMGLRKSKRYLKTLGRA
jgi:hypothetical protein